jgi:ribose 5-phosphate isomerase A
MRNKGGRRKTNAVASTRRNGYVEVMAQETDRDAQKRAAAEAAAALVEDGMVVGLGTGSTAWFVIEALTRRVREGLRILAIPTSERSGAQARDGGIPLTNFAEHPRLDIDIDGADEIELGSLHLIKGLGGALLREKIVAAAADRLVIVADAKKLVTKLGGTAPLPVEVVPFGWETTAARLGRLGTEPVLRKGRDGQPFRTDGGNLILDCAFGLIGDPAALDQAIGQTVGVVESGLFVGMADTAIVGGDDGIVRYSRMGAAPTRTP